MNVVCVCTLFVKELVKPSYTVQTMLCVHRSFRQYD